MPTGVAIVMLLTSTAMPVGAEAPALVLIQLYRDFACEAVMEQPECRGLLEQPKSVLLQYFDDHLANLILADRARVEKRGESGRVNFLPIWDSQDPVGVTVKAIQPTEAGAVAVTLQSLDGTSRTLTFHLQRAKHGWRISDILAHDWSLVELLSN